MQDYYGGSLDGATDRYLDDYAEESERLDACCDCAWCGEKIQPEETAIEIHMLGKGRGYIHKYHIEDADEYTGEELME